MLRSLKTVISERGRLETIRVIQNIDEGLSSLSASDRRLTSKDVASDNSYLSDIEFSEDDVEMDSDLDGIEADISEDYEEEPEISFRTPERSINRSQLDMRKFRILPDRGDLKDESPMSGDDARPLSQLSSSSTPIRSVKVESPSSNGRGNDATPLLQLSSSSTPIRFVKVQSPSSIESGDDATPLSQLGSSSTPIRFVKVQSPSSIESGDDATPLSQLGSSSTPIRFAKVQSPSSIESGDDATPLSQLGSSSTPIRSVKVESPSSNEVTPSLQCSDDGCDADISEDVSEMEQPRLESMNESKDSEVFFGPVTFGEKVQHVYAIAYEKRKREFKQRLRHKQTNASF